MSSSTIIGQRFQRVSSLQKEREAEYGKQASETRRLLDRLRETRIEAEQAAKEEIERTRRIQVEEIQNHPDMVKLRQSLRDLETQSRRWGQDAERKSQELRERIAMLERQMMRKQDELNRVEVQMGESVERESQLRGQIEDLARQLDSLGRDLEGAVINEDDVNTRLKSSYEDHSKMAQELDRLKAQKTEASRQWESLDSKRQGLVNTRDSLQREIERLREDLTKWEQRMSEANEQVRRATGLLAEAQEMCNQHKQRVDSIMFEKEQLGRQLGELQDQRQKANQFYMEVCRDIDMRRKSVEGLEGSLEPLKTRYESIQDQIRRLQDEAISVQNEFNQKQQQLNMERSQLEGLFPTQRDAQFQVNQTTEICRDCEQNWASCEGRAAEAMVRANEFEAKASEAHGEVHRAHELEKEVSEGYNIARMTLDQQQGRFEGIQRDFQSVENKFNTMLNPKYIDDQIRQQQTECDGFEFIYKKMLDDQRVARRQREDIEHQFKATESRIRSLQSQIDEGRGRGPSTIVDRLRDEVRRLEVEIANSQHELGSLGGTNPHQLEFESAKQRFSQLEIDIYNNWSPENAPPRLLDQLKREAEVVMRAEAALTLERQQEAVTADASRLTRYHIKSKPRFDMDQQATQTLLREHTEGKGPREIASTVLEMCEQHHIHA